MATTAIIVEPPTYECLRMTIPVREKLLEAGNTIACDSDDTWSVRLIQPPSGIVQVLFGHGTNQHQGLRLEEEPKFPQEWSAGTVAWWEQGQWIPCPKCGSALVWYEAGYVPGYRICVLNQHHVQLSDDGRSARFMKRQGISL